MQWPEITQYREMPCCSHSGSVSTGPWKRRRRKLKTSQNQTAKPSGSRSSMNRKRNSFNTRARIPTYAKKTLFGVQEQVLEVTGPLIHVHVCLWADLLNKNAKMSSEDTLLLIQRALVLLGIAAHSITVEKGKIAWAWINPKLKPPTSEE